MNPIPFVPRKGEFFQIQKEIERIIKILNITIPIIHVKKDLYLIGTQKLIIQFKQENMLIVRTGGGYFRFDEYIPTHHRFFERTLLLHMIKSKESLEWVCDALINDKKIPQIHNPYEFREN